MIQPMRGHGTSPNSRIGCVPASFHAESMIQPVSGIAKISRYSAQCVAWDRPVSQR